MRTALLRSDIPAHERKRFGALLVAQLFAIFLLPLAAHKTNEGDLFAIAVGLILIAAAIAASERRALMVVVGALMLPTIFAWVGPDLLTGMADEVLRLVTAATMFLFTAGVVANAVRRHQRVSSETLIGAVDVYLLIAFAFMLIHILIEVNHPGSYLSAGEPIIEQVQAHYAGRAFTTFLYFSFTTITTLGYGDIVPLGEVARLATSFEAVIGQLFLAIFIGRLVGLSVGEMTRLRNEADHASEVASPSLKNEREEDPA